MSKCGFLPDGAVAIDAIDFNCGARFGVNFAGAVIVLGEVAIDALHAFFEMNVREMDGFLEAFGIVKGNRFAVFVEPVPFAVVIVDAAENPAVAMEIGELRGLELRIEFGAAGVIEEFFVAPQAASGSRFRIAQRRLDNAALRWDCADAWDTFFHHQFRCPTRLGRSMW